jgi:lipopolysaccharide export system permease protein
LRAVNPLLLLHNKHLVQLKGIYFDTHGASKVGEFANDAILAIPNRHQNRINLMIAKNLKSSSSAFLGEGVTFISPLQAEENDRFDPLLVENMRKSSTSVSDFSQFLQKSVWLVNNDYLKMPLLLVRLQEEIKELRKARLDERPSQEIKQVKYRLHRTFSEISRRISVGIAVLTFTLMGCTFGMSISRRRQYRGIAFTIGLATFYLVAFFTARGLDQYFITSTILYIFPHLLIIACSIWMLWRIARGIE